MLGATTKRITAGIALSLLGWAAAAHSDGGDRPRDVGPRYISPISNSVSNGILPDDRRMSSLILSPVADELKLTADQIQNLKAIYEPVARANVPLMRRLHSHPSAEGFQVRAQLRSELADRAESLDAMMVGVLDPTQRKRLRQIWLQVRDPSALLTVPWAVGPLNLSGGQTDKLKAIVAELWANEAKLNEEHKGDAAHAAAARGAVRQERERALEKMLDLLGLEQVVALSEVLGRPYDVAKLRWDQPRFLTPVPWWHGAQNRTGLAK